jgi:hypothetical protein
MESKLLKYKGYLERYEDCPSSDYRELSAILSRWVHDEIYEADLKPLNMVLPLRELDSDDLKCMGYGLSLFSSKDNARKKYLDRYNRLNDFQQEIYIKEKGTFIAQLHVLKDDGIGNEPNKAGHITFHEYVNTNLKDRIIEITSIFVEDGTV